MNLDNSYTKVKQPLRPISPINGHAPDHSKTLMRKAVKKPGVHIKRQLRAHSPANYVTSEISSLRATHHLKSKSSTHARHTKKSSLISHFVSGHNSQYSNTALVIPKPTLQSASQSNLNKSRIQNRHPKTTADILERALMLANSHEQLPPKITTKKRRRMARSWTAISIVLLVMVIAISQNATNIKLQIANSNAGINASLPKDLPSGYSLSQLEYSKGLVAVRFHSNSTSNSYAIVQRASSWNSNSLVNSFLKTADPNFQTIAYGNLTIYLYGNHDASWIVNGIWYVVQSDGSLSDHQLIEMASSV